MNKSFSTRNPQVAAYILALGAPYPVTAPDSTPGMVVFTFDDPTDEWRQEAAKLNLSDGESDVCSAPAARLFLAQRYLRDDMSRVLGRSHSGVKR